ncbi:MAG TPA: hypothetical protein VG692_08585 [Gemmatimonadales bacterium]|nr:hypothetical protein [Gemmatimonadales bacterium]
MTDLELERRLRAGILARPVPPASEKAMQAILARRLTGHRLALPTDRAPRSTARVRWVAVIGACAAVTLLAVAVPLTTNRGSTGSAAGAFGLRGMDLLYAQATDRPTFPIVRAARPLASGSWSYALLDADARGRPAAAWQQRLAPGRYDGTEAYVWYYGKDGRLTDTLWLDRETLRPMAREAGTAIGTHVTQIFKSDEVLNGVRTAAGMTEWHSMPLDTLGPRLLGGGRAPADFYDSPGVVELWRPQIAATLGTAELGPGWRGSMEGISAAAGMMGIHFWLNLEVVGEEAVTVPAGRFETWKVQVGKRAGYYAWVSKDRQWLIQLGAVEGGGRGRQVLLGATEG